MLTPAERRAYAPTAPPIRSIAGGARRRTLADQLAAGERFDVPGQLAAFPLDDCAPADTERQLSIFDPACDDTEPGRATVEA